MASDALTTMGTCMFDDAVMAAKLPAAVVQRFNECLVSGAPTPEDDSGQRESFCQPFRLFLFFSVLFVVLGTIRLVLLVSTDCGVRVVGRHPSIGTCR